MNKLSYNDHVWHEAKKFVPHRPPMLFVDEVQILDTGKGQTTSIINTDWAGLDEQGNLPEAHLFEIIAQSYAAVAGLQLTLTENAILEQRIGFLAGLKRIKINGSAKLGDKLKTLVSTRALIGDFAVVDGEIYMEKELLAAGQIKIFFPTP